MIKALIFDVDGVLANGEIFSKQYERDFGVPPENITPFFKGRFQECLVGKADLKEEINKHLNEWKWKGSADEFLDYWFRAEHKIDKPLIEYIFLLRRKGMKCYIATNQEKYRTQYIMEKMGFADVFDDIFPSAHLGFTKPNLKFFEEIMNKLSGLDKNEILFWDDMASNVEAARKFGINSEIYDGFENFKSKISKYLL